METFLLDRTAKRNRTKKSRVLNIAIPLVAVGVLAICGYVYAVVGQPTKASSEPAPVATENIPEIPIETGQVVFGDSLNGLPTHATRTIDGVIGDTSSGDNEKKPARADVPAATLLSMRIKIPSIAVDAAIEEVALAADGSMGVPQHPDNTAWYAFGPRPGETGSATIAGHVDSPQGARAVFADLHNVKQGDTIVLQDDKGERTSFVVRESRLYDQKADASEVFRSYDGKSHLNLITCAGAWDTTSNAYAERLVVFADKMTEQ